MMRRALFCFFLAAAPAAAEELAIPEIIYPKLKANAASAAAFAPAGWTLEQSRSGDLNADGTADIVMLMRMADPKNVLANSGGMGEDPFNTNPRILAIAFAEGSGSYRLVLQNHTLIARRTDAVLADSVDGPEALGIERGAAKVTLGFFMSAGGWTMFNATFGFRYQNGRFELIGFDKVTTQRNSGELRIVSINYAAGLTQIETGTIDSDLGKVTQGRLPKNRKALTMDDVGDGLAFDPAPAP
jgi:hypothetical protein